MVKPPLIGLYQDFIAPFADCRTCQHYEIPGRNGRQTKISPTERSSAGLILVTDLISEL